MHIIILNGLHWARQRLDLVAYLTAENLVLRQQLLVLKRGQKRPQIKTRDRVLHRTMTDLRRCLLARPSQACSEIAAYRLHGNRGAAGSET